ncbi:4405_t:CDS:2 [Funneliformis mosseae]|uniref:4405_t:CDS:1 n=1 Tax=Funneliformis mosseae TaxID=27381 RepID=A0A9N9C3N2_FUNMO|nr:4405_t:CDS:2 [Funneliformis mosseae]
MEKDKCLHHKSDREKGRKLLSDMFRPKEVQPYPDGFPFFETESILPHENTLQMTANVGDLTGLTKDTLSPGSISVFITGFIVETMRLTKSFKITVNEYSESSTTGKVLAQTMADADASSPDNDKPMDP